jgi:hypothetical protein
MLGWTRFTVRAKRASVCPSPDDFQDESRFPDSQSYTHKSIGINMEVGTFEFSVLLPNTMLKAQREDECPVASITHDHRMIGHYLSHTQI